MNGLNRALLEHIQRISDETMTRVIWFESETVGDVNSERMLIVEPLSTEIVVDA